MLKVNPGQQPPLQPLPRNWLRISFLKRPCFYSLSRILQPFDTSPIVFAKPLPRCLRHAKCFLQFPTLATPPRCKMSFHEPEPPKPVFPLEYVKMPAYRERGTLKTCFPSDTPRSQVTKRAALSPKGPEGHLTSPGPRLTPHASPEVASSDGAGSRGALPSRAPAPARPPARPPSSPPSPTMGSATANMAAPAAPPPLTDFTLGPRARRLL